MKVIPKHRVEDLITQNWRAWDDEKDRLDLQRLLSELDEIAIEFSMKEVIDDVLHRLKHRAYTVRKDWLSLEGIEQELEEMKNDESMLRDKGIFSEQYNMQAL